eukprot:m.307666 g.307666  ORF g.307666 m.307666 type:complete len:488 (+) comp16463_c1_seq18:124-1587(+)
MNILILLSCHILPIATQTKRPHLIVALADDLGFSDVGWVNSNLKTPTLDTLAHEGIVLYRHYVFMYCSPTRGSLLTGRLPYHDHQLNLGNDMVHGTNRNMTMLPAKLKASGYRTYMIGKWHQSFSSNAYTPLGRGFDKFFGFLGGGEDHITQHINTGPKAPVDFWNNTKPSPSNGTYDTYIYWSELNRMLEEHPKQDPLFLYLSMHNVHEPYEVPERFKSLYSPTLFCEKRQTLQGMVSAVDELVANLTGKMKRLQLWSNYVLVFASDNGGDPYVGGNAPLKGGKATLFEGGVRSVSFVNSDLLPTSVRGTNMTHMIHITDWYRTFAMLAGVNPEDDQTGVYPIDSVDLWPALSGQTMSPPRMDLVLAHNVSLNGNSTGSIIRGAYKMIFGAQGYADYRGTMYPCTPATPAANCNPYCLFNLHNDPWEHDNLYNESKTNKTLANIIQEFTVFYNNLHNLPQNMETDLTGFQNAVHNIYHGYMGPWLD